MTIRVWETHDGDGDLVYSIALQTHSRTTLDKLAALFGRPLAWEGPDDDGDEDLAEALLGRVQEVSA